MKIESLLLKNYSKHSAAKIVRQVGTDSKKFKELMSIFFGGPYRLTQRSVVPVGLCVKREPSLVIPYLSRLISLLSNSQVDDSLKRNILRTLQFIKVPKKHSAKLLDICFQLFIDKHSPIAVRVFSMTVAANISSNFPEIKKELAAVIMERMPYESAGFISRGNKILKQLEQN